MTSKKSVIPMYEHRPIDFESPRPPYLDPISPSLLLTQIDWDKIKPTEEEMRKLGIIPPSEIPIWKPPIVRPRVSTFLSTQRKTEKPKKREEQRKPSSSQARIQTLLKHRPAIPKRVDPKDFNIGNLSPKLGRTLVDNFTDSKEGIIIYDNKLHTLGFPSEHTSQTVTSGVLTYQGIQFPIHESETLTRLEQYFLEANDRNIEQFKSALRGRILKEDSSLKGKISELESSLERQRNSIDYIFLDLISIGEALNNPKKQREALESMRRLANQDIRGQESRDSLSFSGKSTLSQTLETLAETLQYQPSTFLIIANTVYSITPKRELSIDLNSPDSHRYLSDLKQLGINYKKRLKERIAEEAKELFQQQISLVSSKQNAINSASTDPVSISYPMNGKTLSVQKIAANEYLVSEHLPRFLLKRKGEHYLFPETRVATIVRTKSGKVKIDSPGFVARKNYQHPFSGDNEKYGTTLCHGNWNPKSFGSCDIHSGLQNLRGTNGDSIPGQILNVLDATRHILTMGCTGNFNPHKHLTKANFPSEYLDSQEARKMERRGIRLYDNDRVSSSSIANHRGN